MESITLTGFPAGSVVRIHLPVQEMWVQSPGQEEPLENEMEAYSSILAVEIPWTEDLAGYSPWCCKTIGHDLVTT